MLERMAEFFEARLEGYDAHMLKNISGAEKFYPLTAAQLPMQPGASVLDLGCGTGLELEYYFARNPQATVTGIDLSQGMLNRLAEKFPGQALALICGSYFDVPMPNDTFDAAVSVESLHHFTMNAKIGLYTKLRAALKDKGYFILTDYFSSSDEEEIQHFQTLARLKTEAGITDQEFYHFDTPLTVGHEIQALKCAGFTSVEILNRWGATYTLKAQK